MHENTPDSSPNPAENFSDNSVNPKHGQDGANSLDQLSPDSSDRPDKIDQPENPLPALSFDELSPALRAAAESAGWNSLMPVQQLSLPYLLSGRDIMVQSRTGSGKTGAFLLPALERLDPNLKACQAMVLVPTRELALQVEQEAATLFAGSGLEAVAVYGGVGYGKQKEALARGAQLVVGTPGRALDHLLSRNFNLEALQMLVLDEADRMLSIGFYPDMKEVQRYLPRRRIPVHFFSATYPAQVLRVAKEFMPKPEMLSLSHSQVHIASMEHIYYPVKPMEKDRVLIRIIELESPGAAIIFCNTRSNVHYVTAVLKGFGYNADELSSDLTQNQREQVLKAMRRGDLRFLVATDVAGRGIDIPELSHVILYEPPEDHESYVHRAGRTGRAGAGGTVISLVDVMQKTELMRIGKHYKIELKERSIPDEEKLAAVVGERLTSLLEARLRKLTSLQKERLRRFMPLAASLSREDDSLTLLAMLLDEQYYQSLHTRIPGASDTPSVHNAPGEKNRPGEKGEEKKPAANNRRSGRNSDRRREQKPEQKPAQQPEQKTEQKPAPELEQKPTPKPAPKPAPEPEQKPVQNPDQATKPKSARRPAKKREQKPEQTSGKPESPKADRNEGSKADQAINDSTDKPKNDNADKPAANKKATPRKTSIFGLRPGGE
ncbi:MAG: DEAD/DEAH box helicase [Deltaproteobacteria bacterium]|nr:DEAD/DEAH box helicase [Deltaproteobacteria bacterium]